MLFKYFLYSSIDTKLKLGRGVHNGFHNDPNFYNFNFVILIYSCFFSSPYLLCETQRAQFLPLLHFHNLESFIDGTTLPAMQQTNLDTFTLEPNPNYLDWFKKDETLLSWLFSSLIEDMYSYGVCFSSSTF